MLTIESCLSAKDKVPLERNKGTCLCSCQRKEGSETKITNKNGLNEKYSNLNDDPNDNAKQEVPSQIHYRLRSLFQAKLLHHFAVVLKIKVFKQ